MKHLIPRLLPLRVLNRVPGAEKVRCAGLRHYRFSHSLSALGGEGWVSGAEKVPRGGLILTMLPLEGGVMKVGEVRAS